MGLAAGTRLGHYAVASSLGAGGMGEVYRATDTKLGREVALKVLPAEMACHPERVERFRREAKALAALDHPGIVTVHSVEEADGVHFLTMQLVEGQPLDRLIPEGGLPVERLLEIATGLAEALAAAHDRGIVHRDLKPANVMVANDGRVKVLDFGLAKVAEPREGAPAASELPTDLRTREGVVLGTVPYMSPEQVSGRPVDHRTDIFSLGVMLYEMATGRRPFGGASSVELLSSILRDRPPLLSETKPGLPHHLGQIVGRCLEKAREDRLQAASDVLGELRALRRALDSGATAAPATGSERRPDSSPGRAEVPWIVVMPLKAQGADPDLAAFADGLGEDITAGLSRFSHLFVLSRHSVLPYTERSLDVRTVGRELGARYALEGAVRRAGSAVRVSVQLLDAATGTHMWAEAYDRDLAGAGIFEVQDDVTDRVVATVADPYGVLVRSMAVAVRDRPAEELSARELALRCSAYWHHIRPDEHARLRAALERKLEIEPRHAEAWACLSRLVSQEHEFRLNPRPGSVERSREAARQAVEIDPTCQLGWEALAEASYFARDLGTFRNAAEKAMALNPRNTSTLAFMGVLISHGGEWDRGVAIVERSMELNPHHPGWYHFPRFFDHYRKREFDQALATAKRMNMPEDFWTHAVTAAVCGRLGRKEEARDALESLRSLLPGYREELGPTLGLWILDAAVVAQVMEGVAEAEGLVGEPPEAARAAAPSSAGRHGRDGLMPLGGEPPPVPSTPLLGREEALEAAVERLRSGARLLTITGYGGTGKTRFAIELFNRLASGHGGGAAFVSLASVTAAADVLPTLATALAIPEAQGRSALDALGTVIGGRDVLLVLDNLEQVLDAAEDVAALVARCPKLRVVATSRAPLKVGAETEFGLPPLELPAAGARETEALGRCPAVALFVQRAAKVKPGFTLGEANAAPIAEICRRLDGLPLALELAAARTRILEPAALLQRLDHALDLLTSGDRDLPLRQRTLRAAISWSYSLLDAPEQRLLRRLSCFHEGWTLEAMEQVCYAAGERPRALDDLDSLVEKGLVRVVGESGRYALLETIRAFAAEQLHASGEVEGTREAHADHFVALAERIAFELRTPGQLEAMERARRDDANSHAAIAWLTARARVGDARALERALLLCGHQDWFWHITGQHQTARVAYEALLALAEGRAPSRGRALSWLGAGMVSTTTDEWQRSLGEWARGFEDGEALGDARIAAEGRMGMGYCNLSLGRIEAAAEALDDAIARSEPVDAFMHALSMSVKGMLLFATGEREDGIALVREARRIQERIGDHEGGGVAQSFLAQMTFAQGDPGAAGALYREALALLEAVGDHPEVARVHCEMGWTALAGADPHAASESFRRAVGAYEGVGSARGTGQALLGLAAVEATLGRPERAVEVAAAAEAFLARAGTVVAHPMDPGVAERIAALKASIPKAKLDGLVARASTLTAAEALAMVARPAGAARLL